MDARDDLTARFSLTPERLDPPGVWVKRMTAGEVFAFRAGCRAAGEGIDEPTACAWLWVYTVCDEAGARVFGPADVPRVRDFDPAALNAVAGWAAEQNGMTPGAADPKAPSPTTPGSSSRSGSRPRSGSRSARS